MLILIRDTVQCSYLAYILFVRYDERKNTYAPKQLI